MSVTHIVGAGLAGLSAAVELAKTGQKVRLYEAAPTAGGRCRSYFDRELDCRIDNGNHLILSGNHATMDYINTIGARDTLRPSAGARFPFIDLTTGQRWTIAPGPGRIPWWVLRPSRRVPETKLRDYLAIAALRNPGPTATVAALLDRGSPLYRRLLEPLAIAALNTPADEALACLLTPVVNETLLAGGQACEPIFPRDGLSETLIDPAIAFIEAHNGVLQTSCLVSALTRANNRITAITTTTGDVAISPADTIILATPPWITANLLPETSVPTEFQAILNVHFGITATPNQSGFIGLIGGMAEWVFIKPNTASVTISAANRYVDLPANDIATQTWPNVRTALNLPTNTPMPKYRVVKERRATFAATATQEPRRPPTKTTLANLTLAGDWTATGLPATIEGAIRSGLAAARAL